MTAFFFGEAGRQLFGYYHAAAAGGRRAVVLCPSWGPEYQYGHRALRALARRLAERGTHVLRFDYSGTGDSWGDSADGTPDAWVVDVRAAIQELRAMSAVQSVDLVGLRFGAYIASQVAQQRADVRRLVLWDPITDGEAWLGELTRGNRPPITPVPSRSELLEIANRVALRTTVDYFRQISIDGYGMEPGSETLIVRTAGSGSPDPLSPVDRAEYRAIEDVVPWVEDASIWSGLIPARTISTIVEWLNR